MHDQTDMMRLVINLFAAEKTEGLALSQSFWDINDLVTENENEALTAPFFSGNKGIKLVFSVVILLEIGSGRHACGGHYGCYAVACERLGVGDMRVGAIGRGIR